MKQINPLVGNVLTFCSNLEIARDREVAFLRANPEAWLKEVRDASRFIDTCGIEQLTPRELQVLSWVYEGKSNGEISKILSEDGRSPVGRHTIRTHVRTILTKLLLVNRMIAAFAFRDVLDRLLTRDIQLIS